MLKIFAGLQSPTSGTVSVPKETTIGYLPQQMKLADTQTVLSRLEAVMARGDRRLGPVIREAVRLGARLDGWDEYFRYDLWMQAFQSCGVDPAHYTTRGFGEDEILPWRTIDVGVSEKFLWREREKAYASETTPDCRTKCGGCGANRLSERGKCDE